MTDEFEWDHDDIVDLDGCADVTGDPQLDVFGYQSPRRNMGPPPAPEFDWLAQMRWNQAQAEADDARRAAVQANLAETRRRRDERRGQPQPVTAEPVAPPVWYPQPTAPHVPQHGAYFEVRTVRVWWAPWRKKRVWTQVSSWHLGGPPAGATVVTVPDVAALPGKVTTTGTVSETGAVEW